MTSNIISPLRVRERCREYASRLEPRLFDDKRFGAIIGSINAAIKQLSPDGLDITNQNRRLVFAFLFLAEDRPFEPVSAKGLTAQQKHALEMWVGSVHDAATDTWLPRATFKAEAVWILEVTQYFWTLTNWNKEHGNIVIYMHTLLEGYRIEAGAKEDLVESGYWLVAAMDMPGAVLTKIYENIGGETE